MKSLYTETALMYDICHIQTYLIRSRYFPKYNTGQEVTA